MRFAKLLTSTMLCALSTAAAAASPAMPAAPATPAAPAAAAVPASAANPPIRKLDGHLVDSKGRGLYTWDGDKQGSDSQCNAQCRILWPPLFAAADAVPKGPFDLVKRDEGRYQWALKGRPLYRWASDKKWGDAGGDGVGGVWHLVTVTVNLPKKAGQ